MQSLFGNKRRARFPEDLGSARQLILDFSKLIRLQRCLVWSLPD